MKHFGILAVLTLFSISATTLSMAQDDGTRIAIAIKKKELETKKATLIKRIEIEDKKRNQVVAGMNHNTLEELNIKQDSICLELRSQLVDVELALKELNNKK